LQNSEPTKRFFITAEMSLNAILIFNKSIHIFGEKNLIIYIELCVLSRH
jgi:hypothetical protein